MKLTLATAAICAALGVVSWVSYYVGGAKMSQQVSTTFSEAQKAYLAGRFDRAYAQESASIAVWEGTNLITYLELDRVPAQSRSKEEKANRAFLDARVSKLFRELGDSGAAQDFAAKALEWCRAISMNQGLTLDTAVEEILARDAQTRKTSQPGTSGKR